MRLMAELDPSLVLLDYHLPDMSGLDILRETRAAGNQVPVIAVTADARVELATELYAAGANGLVTKPFDFDVLLQTVALHAPSLGLTKSR